MDVIYILKWLKELGPFLLALAVFIATWQFQSWQVRLAKQKLRHDLYDRRFAIYFAFQELLLALLEKRDDEIKAAFRKASIARLEAPFLLSDPDIQTYLENLCKQVTDKVIGNIMYRDGMRPPLEAMPPEIKQEFVERVSQLGQAKLDIVQEHDGKLSEQFEKFLKLTDFQDGQ